MSAKVLNWQLLVGFGLVFAGSGTLLHLNKIKHGPAQLKYWEIADTLRSHPNYDVQCLTPTDDPRLGLIVTRAGDQRDRYDLASASIHDREGFVVLVRLEGFTLRDPIVQFRFADCEMSGDADLLQEIIEELKD